MTSSARGPSKSDNIWGPQGFDSFFFFFFLGGGGCVLIVQLYRDSRETLHRLDARIHWVGPRRLRFSSTLNWVVLWDHFKLPFFQGNLFMNNFQSTLKHHSVKEQLRRIAAHTRRWKGSSELLAEGSSQSHNPAQTRRF